MIDYTIQSEKVKAKIDANLAKSENWRNDITPEEKPLIISAIHNGQYCAECWASYYQCLCSHEN
jgi:hypothetical protein